jgi:hypothetical protein
MWLERGVTEAWPRHITAASADDRSPTVISPFYPIAVLLSLIEICFVFFFCCMKYMHVATSAVRFICGRFGSSPQFELLRSCCGAPLFRDAALGISIGKSFWVVPARVNTFKRMKDEKMSNVELAKASRRILGPLGTNCR